RVTDGGDGKSRPAASPVSSFLRRQESLFTQHQAGRTERRPPPQRAGRPARTRYCTLNICCGSVHTCCTASPALSASAAKSASEYLQLYSTWIASSAPNLTVLRPIATCCARRLTICVSTRPAIGL